MFNTKRLDRTGVATGPVDTARSLAADVLAPRFSALIAPWRTMNRTVTVGLLPPELRARVAAAVVVEAVRIEYAHTLTTRQNDARDPPALRIPPVTPPALDCKPFRDAVKVTRWPRGNGKGNTSGTWTSGGFEVSSAGFRWDPLRFEALGMNGCFEQEIKP